MDNYNLSQIPSEAQIRKILRKSIFDGGVHCPHCGSRNITALERRYHCKKCRKKFSLISGSWLKGAKLSLTKICTLLWCWQAKSPPDQACLITGASMPTVRHWYDKFRSGLPLQLLEGIRLKGKIQSDECFRKGYSILGMKQEAADSKKRKMALVILFKNSVDRSDVVDLMSRTVKPGSILRTDGASIYKKIEKWWPVEHQSEIHKNFEFAITSEIEGLWGNLFTFIRRMYHHITVAKIKSIVNEFCFRQCFEQYFQTPEKYLALSLVKLTRKNPRKFSRTTQSQFSFIKAKKISAFVPTCF
jgi:transposase-like protein